MAALAEVSILLKDDWKSAICHWSYRIGAPVHLFLIHKACPTSLENSSPLVMMAFETVDIKGKCVLPKAAMLFIRLYRMTEFQILPGIED